MSTDLDLELEAGQKRQRHRVERVVVGRGVKLQQHRVSATDDIGHRVTPAKSHQDSIGGRATVVNGEVVLHHVALIPNPEKKKNNLIYLVYQISNVDQSCIAATDVANYPRFLEKHNYRVPFREKFYNRIKEELTLGCADWCRTCLLGP